MSGRAGRVKYPLVPQAEARAALAQSVERFTRNEKVASSILASGSTAG